jgi:uncharacterized protein DUF4386
MTTSTREAPEQHPRAHTPPPTAVLTACARRAGLVGGLGILLLAALAGFGGLAVVAGLVTEGDPAATARDISASEGMFRVGVASLYVVVVLDVVVAWALFRYFSPVSGSIARLAAWFRLAYAGVYLVAISQLAGIPDLLRDDGYATALGEKQVQAQALLAVDSYQHIWLAGLILFGAHLLLVGYLAYRSGYVPRLLGVLLAVAGAGYVLDTLSSVLFRSPVTVSTFTFMGEFLLAVWLVVRSRSSRTEVDGHAV